MSSFETGPAVNRVHLADGVVLQARLLVAADGVKSRLRDMAGIKTVHLGLRPVRHRLHRARTNVRTTGGPKSISCLPVPSPSCR